MAGAVETAKDVAESGQAGSTLGGYLSAHWHELLILVIIAALLIYMVIELRKRFAIVREFMQFLKERKMWWMTPIVVIFLLLAVLIVTMESSAIAPFIYALF
jgi:uncharacterized membrane protein YfcA